MAECTFVTSSTTTRARTGSSPLTTRCAQADCETGRWRIAEVAKSCSFFSRFARLSCAPSVVQSQRGLGGGLLPWLPIASPLQHTAVFARAFLLVPTCSMTKLTPVWRQRQWRLSAGAIHLLLVNESFRRGARRSTEIKRDFPTTACGHHGRGRGSEHKHTHASSSTALGTTSMSFA